MSSKRYREESKIEAVKQVVDRGQCRCCQKFRRDHPYSLCLGKEMTCQFGNM